MSKKITEENQPCRKCGTPVIKIFTDKNRDLKNQNYYFEWYLQCPECKINYMVEAAKVMCHNDTPHKIIKTLPTVIIYTDGSTLKNGQENSNGAGAAILGFTFNGREHWKAFGEFMSHSTNQTAEITAACVGLEALKTPCNVVLRSDSRYVVETMRGLWKKKANLEYWERLIEAARRHNILWEWVKGHNLHPQQEEADRLAGFIARGGKAEDFKIDFEQHAKKAIERKNRVSIK